MTAIPVQGRSKLTKIGILLAAAVSLCTLTLAAGQKPAGDRLQAKVSYYQGNYEKAAKEYDRLLAHAPEDKELLKDQALVLMADHHLEKALQLLQHAQDQGVLMGQAYLANGELARAAEEFKKVLSTPGDHFHERLLLGWIATKTKDYHQAVNWLWQALREYSRLATAHLLLGRTFQGLAQSSLTEGAYFIKRAKEEYHSAVKDDASLWPVYRDLAMLAEKENAWIQARRYWRRVRSIIGLSQEVKSAQERLAELVPTPTISPTPGPRLVASSLPPPVFKDITIQPLGQKDDPVIKVGLGKALPSLWFGCLGPWRALDRKGRNFWKGRARQGYRINQVPGKGWMLMTWDGKPLKRINQSITLKPLNPEKVLVVFKHYLNAGYFWSGGTKSTSYYRGRLTISPSRKTLKLVNEVLLEDYLLSVVPGEMPASWPLEALKTQAVVARTDTLNRRNNHRKDGYDVCATTHCAVYRGVTVEHSASHEAVASTQGEVLEKNGRLLPTFYSHACGGLTQGYKEAWWKKGSDPYNPQGIADVNPATPTAASLPLSPARLDEWLTGTPSVFCSDTHFSGKHSFRWIKIMEQDELSEVIDRKYHIGTLKAIRIRERSPSGYVRHIELIGDKGTHQVYRDYIRSALGGLRSNLFELLPLRISPQQKAAEAWLIWGGGWGHGVGLCQAGAGAMGNQGFDYLAILNHYFPDGELKLWSP